jgi:hypothetical protein
MAWVDLSGAFTYGTILESADQQALRDNIAAAFAKDSGAPTLANNYIENSMVGSDAIHSTQIKVADGSSGQDTSTGTGIKTDHLQHSSVSSQKFADDVLSYLIFVGG